MKSSSRPALFTLLALFALALAACATAANRRVLYYPTEPRGPWHDYHQRQVVAAQIGVPASALPTPTATTVLPGVVGPGATPTTVIRPVISVPTQATLPPPSVTTELPAPAPPPASISQ